MRLVSRTLLVVLLGSILLSACGAVTPIAPSATPTVFVSPTPQLIKTAVSPDLAVTPVPTVTVEPVSSDYQLRPWIADDDFYAKLVEEHSEEFYSGINNDSYQYDLVFQAENLLRDNPSDWQDVAWQIVKNYPKGIPLPGMRPNEDLLAFLIEDLLNNQHIKPDELMKVVGEKTSTSWDCYHAEIADSPSKEGNYLVVKNLFGNKEDGQLFYAGDCRGTAVYALRNVDNKYRIEKLRDWQAMEIPFAGYYLSIGTVSDVNNNGIPEVAINVSYGASGTPPFFGKNIEFYEWDPSHQVFLSDKTPMFEDICSSFESCDNEWTIEKANVQGVKPILVKEMYITMDNGLDGSSICEPLVIQHKYLWKNAKFIEQEGSQLLPPTDKRVECQLSWSLQVLNKRVDDWNTASEIISKALVNWPVEMNDIWGVASKDYFALRLGLAYDMMGQEGIAQSLIQNVAERPSDTFHKFLPQLASTYLNIRSKQGKVKACAEINLLQTESEFKDDLLGVIYVPVDKLREVWGYGASLGTDKIDDICNAELALNLLVKQDKPSQFTNISDWLKGAGLQPSNVNTVYQSNALTVWLALLPSQTIEWANDGVTVERSDHQQAWLFAKSLSNFTATYVDDVNQNEKVLVDYLQLRQNELLATIQKRDVDPKNFFEHQHFFIFHITQVAEIQNQLEDFFVESEINRTTNEVETIAATDYSPQFEITIYRWNSELEKLDERTINFDFSSAQARAEWLIFRDHDFSGAIHYIAEFLTQAPPEPRAIGSCSSDRCNYYPDWYRPYMRYLLALSYEMSGQTDQTRDAYFDLWQDYPTNIFGLAAEHRLVAVKP